MVDILFIHPPVTFSKKLDLTLDYPRLGTMCLASVLEKEEFSVGIIDNRDGFFSLNKVLEEIERRKPRILGLSSMTSNIRGTVQLAKAVRERWGGEISLGLGGPHASADPTIIKRFSFFDWLVMGEGEITVPKIAREIIKEGKKVEGIFRGEVPFNLDEFPFPSWHLIDWSRYKIRTNNIMASRGCPFKCIFCSIPAIERKTRFRNPQAVTSEMKKSQKYTGVTHYTFLDDTLTLNRNFFYNVCQEIIKQKLKITFEGHTRANLIDEELIKKMKEAGLTELIFGVESGNERIRNEIVGKKIKDKDIKKAFSLCKKYKIKADMYLMLGFPTETEREIEDTINYPLKVRPNVFGLHITIPLPGAPLWEIAIKEGIIPPDTIDKYIKGEFGEGFNEVWPLYVPQGLTLKYLEDARARAYRGYYFNPSFLLKRALEDLRDLKSLGADFNIAWNILTRGNVKDV